MSDQINVGDEVIVVFNRGSVVYGTVLYTPSGPGDVWIIREPVTNDSHRIIYVNDYNYIYKTVNNHVDKSPTDPVEIESTAFTKDINALT